MLHANSTDRESVNIWHVNLDTFNSQVLDCKNLTDRILLVTRPGPTQGDGAVYYSIKSINTDATVFEMDAVSGEITFGLPARADLVQDGQFSIVVRATDGGKDPGPLHTDIQVSTPNYSIIRVTSNTQFDTL